MTTKKSRFRDLFSVLIACFLCGGCAFIFKHVHTLRSVDEFESREAAKLQAAEPPQNEVPETILLAGDGGAAPPQAVALLRSELALSPNSTTALFLGDNAYPNGIELPSSPKYARSVERLMRQVSAVKETRVRGVFIPGNHDWNFEEDEGGWEAILRQQTLVESELGPGSFLPRNGCPGPVVAYASDHFRVIALDTEWWIYSGKKPSAAVSGCDTYSPEMVLDSLRRLLGEQAPGRRDIIIMHHPLRSVGPHEYRGECPSDFTCPAYRRMREELLGVFREFRPFLCAAGHDHSLQLFKDAESCRWFVVSGSLSNATGIRRRRDLLVGYSEHGLFRLARHQSGGIYLTAVHLSKESGQVERLTTLLESF